MNTHSAQALAGTVIRSVPRRWTGIYRPTA